VRPRCGDRRRAQAREADAPPPLPRPRRIRRDHVPLRLRDRPLLAPPHAVDPRRGRLRRGDARQGLDRLHGAARVGPRAHRGVRAREAADRRLHADADEARAARRRGRAGSPHRARVRRSTKSSRARSSPHATTGTTSRRRSAARGSAIPGPFARFGATPLAYRRPAPRIGEHNREIYEGELGLDVATLEGVI
jgi:hypothetical protein